LLLMLSCREKRFLRLQIFRISQVNKFSNSPSNFLTSKILAISDRVSSKYTFCNNSYNSEVIISRLFCPRQPFNVFNNSMKNTLSSFLKKSKFQQQHSSANSNFPSLSCFLALLQHRNLVKLRFQVPSVFQVFFRS
jgi:hypothetical protein